MLGRQPNQCRASAPIGGVSALPGTARFEAPSLHRPPTAPCAAPAPVDGSTAARSPGRWALRVLSEVSTSAAQPAPAAAAAPRADTADTVERAAALSNGAAHLRRHEPPFSETSSSHDQHLALIEQSLGGSAPIWQSRRESEAEHRRSREQLRQQCRLTLSEENASPSDLALFAAEFARLNDFESALQLMDHLSKNNNTEALEKINQRIFMDSCKLYKQGAAAVAFLHALPKRFHDIRLYNMVLQTCAHNRDFARAQEVMDLVDKHRVKKDVRLLTTMINACKSVGNAEMALRFFQDLKATNVQLDGQVYGTVVAACAEAMLRELSVVHERKDQYVLMERAFQLVAEAVEGGQVMPVPVYNSLLVCAGRSGQLGRAFEVLDYMSAQKLSPDEQTYGSLIEACVQANKQQLALKVFGQAVKEGHHTIQIYTQAVSACKIDGCVDLDKAMEVYALMQRAGVSPDKKFYAALMAVAGKAGRLDIVLEHLQSVADDRLVMSTTLANGLLYAAHKDLGLMRKVYALCAQQGVYPEVSQFNRLMDWYTEQGRFGEVVSLVCDMVGAGLLPNINTYRIILNACQRAGQAQLALEVYAAMKAKKIPILQEKFARIIFFTLLKTCQNQILCQSAAHFEGKPAPWKLPKVPSVRMAEAEKLIAALRSTVGAHSASTTGRATSGPGSNGHGHGQVPLGTGLMALAPESINWQQQALMLYRDYLNTGYSPHLLVLDVVLRCLRLRLQQDDEGSAVAAAAGVSSAGASPDQFVSNGLGGGAVHMAGSSMSASGSMGVPGLPGHHQTALGALAFGLPGTFGPAAASRRGSVPIDFGTDAAPVSRQPWEVLKASSALPAMGSGKPVPGGSSSNSASSSTAGVLAPAAEPASMTGGDAPSDASRDAASSASVTAASASLASSSISDIPPPSPPPALEASTTRRYEMPFDRRALGLLEDAMHKGFLPNVKGVEEGPMTFDLRLVPPTVAEVILVSVLASLDKRAAKTGRCQVFHNVTFFVPPSWDPDLIMWPSYVERMYSGGRSKASSEADKAAEAAGAAGAAGASEAGEHDGSEEQERAQSRSDAHDEDAHASGYGHDEHDGADSEEQGDTRYEQHHSDAWQQRQDDASRASTSGHGHSHGHGREQGQSLNGNVGGHASTSAAAAAAAMPYRAAAALDGMAFTAADAVEAMRSSGTQADSLVPSYSASQRTSLALMAACKRMKVFFRSDPDKGTVTLSANELSRWLINRRQFVSRQQQAHLHPDDVSSGDGAGSRRRSRQRASVTASASLDTMSSTEEEEYQSYPAQAGGMLMPRPRHRPPRRTRPKRPSSRQAAPGADLPLSGMSPAAPTAVPTSVALPSAAPGMVGQVTTVDSGLMLGGGIHISVPSTTKGGVEAHA